MFVAIAVILGASIVAANAAARRAARLQPARSLRIDE
jgi:ABC-type lipoprotein release transport system permease subunit